MSKEHKAIPLNQGFIVRKVYKRVPYGEITKEFKQGRGIFIEAIKRQTASYAAKKLTKMMGRKVVQHPAFLKLKGEVLDGYTFELEETERSLSSRQKNTSAFSR